MFMPSDWGHGMVEAVSQTIIDKQELVPEELIIGLFSHATVEIDLGGRPKTLGEYCLYAIVARLLEKFKIKPTGSKILDFIPIKNTNVYEHSFKTEDGREFFCYQFGPWPNPSVNQLSVSIFEHKTDSGCIHCQYTGFFEEDINCTVCRNGATKKLLDRPEIKIFKKHGIHIFKEIIGDKYWNIIEQFVKEYKNFYSAPDQYLANCVEKLSSYASENEFGKYFTKEIEHDICIKIELIEDEEDDSETEGSSD